MDLQFHLSQIWQLTSMTLDGREWQCYKLTPKWMDNRLKIDLNDFEVQLKVKFLDVYIINGKN